jgi:hypothetical protein
MDPSAARITASERARAAFEAMKKRQSVAANGRRMRERIHHVKWAVVATGVIVGLSVIALYKDWLPQSQRTSVQSKAIDGFGESRTGQVRLHVTGNVCHDLKFNNDTGMYVKGSVVPCRIEAGPDGPGATPSAAGARLNSIRDAFTGR